MECCRTYPSSELAKRTSAVFVEDDHSLLQPSTMALVSKTLTEFLDLGEGAVPKEDGATEEETRGGRSPPLQRDIEVTNPSLAWLAHMIYVLFFTRVFASFGENCRYFSRVCFHLNTFYGLDVTTIVYVLISDFTKLLDSGFHEIT